MIKLERQAQPAPSATPSWFWQESLLALGSGWLTALAAPPLGLWPLAWVGLIPLWILITAPGRSWRTAFLFGLIWGVGFHGSAISWITHLHPLTWMGVPWLASVAIAAFAWGFITLWGAFTVGLWAVGLRWLQRFPVRTRVLVATALWCLLEGLRNQTPLDWSSLALTQSPNNLWILQLSQLAGQTGVVALIVSVNGLLAEASSGLLPTKARSHKLLRVLLATGLALLIGGHSLGAVLLITADADLPTAAVSIGLIQGNVPTRVKLTPAGINQALEGYLTGYQTLVAQGVDAVLTPEGALPTVWTDGAGRVSPQMAALMQAVTQAGVPLWLGTFASDRNAPLRTTQSLVEISGQGQISGRYNKVKLVPLGEYLPLEPLLSRLIARLSPLDSYLVPGQPKQQFSTRLGTAIVGICYESAYGQLFRQQTQQGGEFILTASNNDPYPPRMMAQHHALDVIRAIENSRWAVRATNTGISGIVSPQGRTQWLAPAHTYAAHQATIYRRQSITPYVRWGNWLLLLLGGLSLAALVKSSTASH